MPNRLTVDMHPLAYWRRQADGLSQAELARRVGIHPVTLSRIEAGAEPGVRVALRLAAEVGVAVEDVWAADGSPPPRFVEHRRRTLRYAMENRSDKGAGLAHLRAWLA